MRRLLAGLVAVTLLLLVWIFSSSVKSSKFVVGPPLPPGKVAPQLISTFDAAVLIAPDGSLWGWGGGQLKQSWLLPNPNGGIPRPQRIGSDSDWRKLATGFVHTLALKTDGTLWAWGNNSDGELGQPPTNRSLLKPTQIGVETDWAEISVGAGHSIALKRDGSLWTWGQGQYGQLGDGTTSNRYIPVRISPDLGWKSIAASDFNGYALRNDGTIWAWGLDPTNGMPMKHNVLVPTRIDAGTNWSFISAVDYVLMALKSDGTLWIRGQNSILAASYYVKSVTTNFTRIGTDTNWQEVYAGRDNFFARKRDGSWWTCESRTPGPGRRSLGHGSAGPLYQVPFDFDPWAFANGFGNTLLLTRDGTLWTWGERLGWKAPSMQQKLKAQLSRLIALVTRRSRPINIPTAVIDSQPYRLWELPTDMRRKLGTNSTTNGTGLSREPEVGH
jgi:alpha-tubulin suppressor-like RCC1 family protein